MGTVAAGLIGAVGLKLAPALAKNPMGKPVCWALMALTFVAIAVLRIPLFWVLVVLGGVACGWAWQRLAAAPA